MLECPIAEAKLRQLLIDPVLSIVIPTYQRSDELALTVTSIANQLQGDLAQKVEIILTDNASGPDTVGKIKFLAEQYPSVSYLLHRRDEGVYFQFFAAPWRARGRWTWVFGSDDLLLDGGVRHVVDILEREQPSFLTLNRKLYDRGLAEEIWGQANAVADRRFDRFEDLMQVMGLHQLVFVSGNIELTEAARAFDPYPFLTVDSRHAHIGAYLEKHHGRPARYASAPYLIQRINDAMGRDHVSNSFDFGVTLPVILDDILHRIGAPEDFLERMTGDLHIQAYDDPDGPTFVDHMLEHLLLAIAGGRYFTLNQRWALEGVLARCAPHRLRQLSEIWQMQHTVQELDRQAEIAGELVKQGRETCAQASRSYTRQG